MRYCLYYNVKVNISFLDFWEKTFLEVLKKNNISYYDSGIEHGTITASEDKYKFEITTLRKDVSTDGRHATVQFSKAWKEDASRRAFSINSIYSDRYGNLFDPYNGKQDLENGLIRFIGDADKTGNQSE